MKINYNALKLHLKTSLALFQNEKFITMMLKKNVFTLFERIRDQEISIDWDRDWDQEKTNDLFPRLNFDKQENEISEKLLAFSPLLKKST